MTFAYATSHRIDIVNGRLRKDLSTRGLIGDARWVKRSNLHDPGREPAVYRLLLGPAGIGPRCHDAGDDWVLLDQAPGVPLWQCGDADVWVRVAGWLARMHTRLAATAETLPVRPPFLVQDAEFYRDQACLARRAGAPGAVLAAHAAAAQRVLALQAGVIHGDFYPSNIVVGTDVCPVDWELAGWASPLLDLAALTAGGLTRAVRDAMVRAYYDASSTPRPWAAFVADLDACRLLVCVQWLGWSCSWKPPAAHAHDWLAEARRLANAGLEAQLS